MRMIRIVVLGVVAAAAVVALFQLPVDVAQRAGREPVPPPPASTASADTGGKAPTPAPTRPSMRARAGIPKRVVFPVHGTGRFHTLPGNPATIGGSGRLLTFHLMVEGGITGIDRNELGSFVRATFADPNGWTAGGRWRFRQVGPGEHADFMLMLVTPATRDDLCGGGYDRYTSCRNGDHVVLNIDRWVNGVPNYGAPLTTYRQYMINHETGHRLGQAHELCPSPGSPAPVMQQQTHGLNGCTANPWPYRNGQRHRGPYAS